MECKKRVCQSIRLLKRPLLTGFVISLTAALVLAGNLLPAAAQGNSPRVFLPLLSVPQADSSGGETVFYDLVADAKSDDAWSKVESAYTANNLVASRDGTAVEIQDESGGTLRTLVDISCEGQKCTRARKPKVSSILTTQNSPQAFEVIVEVDATTTLRLLLENSRRLRVEIVKSGKVTKTTVFTCKTGTCTIQLAADDWATPTPTSTPESTATPTPTPTSTDGQTGDGPFIESFILVDSATNQDIRPLADGDTIDLAVNPNMTVRVATQPAAVGSVQFTLDGSTTYPDGTLRRENVTPYSLNGDNNGNFNVWTPSLGQHTIEAVAYSEADGGGTTGPKKTLTLNIVQGDESTPPATSTATPTADQTATPTGTPTPTATPRPTAEPGEEPAIVFVSRQIPNNGSIYWDVPKDMPGVGPHSRFRVAAPGKLLVREPNGQIRTLIDGANPTAASLNLIDVNAPDVSYDGNTIVFAGLPQGDYNTGPASNPGAWRIYTIQADGTNLRQVTFTEQQFTREELRQRLGADTNGFYPAADPIYDHGYDDTDPAWLPDGRIVFSSTRYPSYAQYSGVPTSNLHVVKADGTDLRRITTERNGADRPLVDPVTGKIVYARWWRNHRFAIDALDTVEDPDGGYVRKDGLSSDRNNQVGGSDFLWRNQWHAATINPDGTGLAQWGGPHHKMDASHMYGGAFTPDGQLIANYFPMANMTEAGGFGGLRLYQRGPGNFTSIIGVTYLGQYPNASQNPPSHGVMDGAYASDPTVLPDGRLVISWAPDYYQDYGLYIINADGSNLTELYDVEGTTELRAKVLAARPTPPIIQDQISQAPSLLPPTAEGPYDVDGTFTFDALNVYFNAPVDAAVDNAPAVGSADTIRFFIDHQRTYRALHTMDWPILIGQLEIEPDGSVRNPTAPANVPLFEQLRSADGLVPRTSSTPGTSGGAAHVAGMNFGRPGEVQRCVGCHAGHTMIEVPANDADAQWTNLAPGAEVRVSSTGNANQNRGLIDRRVMKGEIWRYWTSSSGQTQNQWVELVFPVPVTVRTVRLYNPRSGGDANSSVQVQGTSVRLYSDANATNQVASASSGALSVEGTDVAFADVRARVVRVEITGVSGTFYGAQVASLAEIEVIARGEANN